MGCVPIFHAVITRSHAETEAFGFKIGQAIKAKLKSANVCLYGDLGAGKTTLIKGIAAAFGISKRDVGSASFVIVAEYETSPPFYHIDLYRLERAEDVEALGLWEYLEAGGVSVIEWAERLPETPDRAVTVKIGYLDEDSREISIEGIPDSFFEENTVPVK